MNAVRQLKGVHKMGHSQACLARQEKVVCYLLHFYYVPTTKCLRQWQLSHPRLEDAVSLTGLKVTSWLTLGFLH